MELLKNHNIKIKTKLTCPKCKSNKIAIETGYNGLDLILEKVTLRIICMNCKLRQYANTYCHGEKISIAADKLVEEWGIAYKICKNIGFIEAKPNIFKRIWNWF